MPGLRPRLTCRSQCHTRAQYPFFGRKIGRFFVHNQEMYRYPMKVAEAIYYHVFAPESRQKGKFTLPGFGNGLQFQHAPTQIHSWVTRPPNDICRFLETSLKKRNLLSGMTSQVKSCWRGARATGRTSCVLLRNVVESIWVTFWIS
jgi:hypothetical protein